MQKNNSGQALLIVLIAMSVVATIALSVVSRSITDISVTGKEEYSLRAFSAAEAGIEKALLANSTQTQSGSLPSGGTFTATVTNISEGSTEFASPIKLLSGESGNIWFIGHNDNGALTCSGQTCFTGSTLKFCWGDRGAQDSAVELAVFYKNGGRSKVARAAYDANAVSHRNNFSTAVDRNNCSANGTDFAFSKNVNLNSDLGIPNSVTSSNGGLLFARMKLLYNNSSGEHIGVVSTSGVLPRQGLKIESVGKASDTTRKVILSRLFPDLPPIFDYGVFSGQGALSKE